MTFGYVQPFSFTIAPTPAVRVASVRHGVTEITLSDGRLVRARLHVKDVKINAQSQEMSTSPIMLSLKSWLSRLCRSSKCMRRFSKAAAR
jgi:hypothetical protein